MEPRPDRLMLSTGTPPTTRHVTRDAAGGLAQTAGTPAPRPERNALT
ncbi:hypothetical protein [Nocardia sp. NPDC049526]